MVEDLLITTKKSSSVFHDMIPEEYRTDEPISTDEIAQMQCDWYNDSEGKLTGIDCKECKNRGYFQMLNADGIPVLKECKCMAERRYVKVMIEAGLEDIYQKCTFDSYKAETDWQKLCRHIAMKYAEQDGNNWLYFGGASGSGKTHLCTAVCSVLAKRGRSIKYVQWKRILAQLIQTKFKLAEQEKILDEIINADVLYIDDFLKTPRNANPSEEALSFALDIVDARYKADRKTIFSSEFLTREILDFDEALGGRIVEKSPNSKILLERVKGRNYRIKED